MKNKGFTLVELLAVVTILGALIIIIMPRVLDTIEDSKNRLYNEQIKRINEAAEMYVQENDVVFTGGVANIALKDIIDGGFLESPVKNPKTKAYFDENETIVQVTKSGSSSSFVVIDVDANLDQSGANIPQLLTGLIPVYYDENDMVWRKADPSNTDERYQWYDYKKFMWANAVTVKSTARSQYLSAGLGESININDINTFFVWIPRYAYKIPGGTGAREVKIKWEKNTDTRSLGDAIVDYYTLPGFKFGLSELTGLWFGKFETTGTSSAITILPYKSTYKSHTNKQFFDAVKTNVQSSATYGFSTDSDAHMLKNTEWATILYLSNSRYGKYGNPSYSGANKEIYINNSSSSLRYSGISSGAPGGTGFLSPTYEYTTYGYYKYNGKCSTIYAGLIDCETGIEDQTITNKLLAYGASTTGTIYGVFDAAGGSWDRTMGVYKPDVLPGDITDLSGFSSTTTASTYDLLTIDSKYYDVYKTSSSLTACDGYCYGHGLSGTAGWYGDYSGMPDSSMCWITRGSKYNQGAEQGIFAYASTDGSAATTTTSRIILVKS